MPAGRITLVEGVSHTEADVIGATAIHLAIRYGHQTFVNGSVRSYVGDLSLELDADSGHSDYHQANKNFPVFEYWDGSGMAWGTGPAWEDPADLEDLIEDILGGPANKGAITLRVGTGSGDTVSLAAHEANYLGSIRTTANGVTENSNLKRFVSNAINVWPCKSAIIDGTVHQYSGGWRQYRDQGGNQIEFLLSLPLGQKVVADLLIETETTNNNSASVGIGLDGATLPAPQFAIGPVIAGGYPTGIVPAKYQGNPGCGYHRLIPLQAGGANAAQQWDVMGFFVDLGLQ